LPSACFFCGFLSDSSQGCRHLHVSLMYSIEVIKFLTTLLGFSQALCGCALIIDVNELILFEN